MSDKDRMPHVDLSKLKQSDLDFMKKIETQNKNRVEALNRLRKRNNITGAIIGCVVLGIYSYSIYAVKQERFLDDFEEPSKIIEKQ